MATNIEQLKAASPEELAAALDGLGPELETLEADARQLGFELRTWRKLSELLSPADAARVQAVAAALRSALDDVASGIAG